jgi:phenylpropionate dioxygenase-like ring-hydroxylating dioxygenase large terminal subunit
MPCSLQDAAYNTMDLRHPEYVHNSIFGFGNGVPPNNIKYHVYHPSEEMMGLSFEYASTSFINIGSKFSENFHMFRYPSFSWSKVSINKTKDLIISVELLPISEKKTRWFVTICHNYYKTPLKKKIMKGLASVILTQDYVQMKQQVLEDEIKHAWTFNNMFKNEEVIMDMNEYFKSKYSYPNKETCVNLIKYHNDNFR